MKLDAVTDADRAELLALAVETGLFMEDDAEGLLGGVLTGLAAGELPDGHAAVACRATLDGPIVGWTYFAPDPYAAEVWNLWWIGVPPRHHGTGVGEALLAHAEQAARGSGARILIIETSDGAPMARARRFYAKHGYDERGRIPDFYADGEAKVVFSRRLAPEP